MPTDRDPRVHPMAGDETEGRDTIHTVTLIYSPRDWAPPRRGVVRVYLKWHDKHGHGGGEMQMTLAEWRRRQKNRKVVYAAD